MTVKRKQSDPSLYSSGSSSEDPPARKVQIIRISSLPDRMLYAASSKNNREVEQPQKKANATFGATGTGVVGKNRVGGTRTNSSVSTISVLAATAAVESLERGCNDNSAPTLPQTPQAVILEKLSKRFIPVRIQSYSTLLESFFQAPTEAEIQAYDHDVLNAVRSGDLDTLRQYHANGRPLKCSNKFGESLLHLACRKGMLDVTKFLVQEANVPLQVCDDYGKSPLTDVCWTNGTNFELIDFVLSQCPDLLYIEDKRGNTPLAYVRRDQHGAWKDYLHTKTAASLRPRCQQLWK